MVQEIKTGAVKGVEGYLVTAEIDVANGLPCFEMVGNLGHEVKESAERVRVALKNCGYELPPKRVTINLSPAGIRKGGTAFDLPIAIGILAAMGIVQMVEECDFIAIGELGLNGGVRGVPGILPILIMAKELGIKKCILPQDNYREACFIDGIELIAVQHIFEIVGYFDEWGECESGKKLELEGFSGLPEVDGGLHNTKEGYHDFEEIIGQKMAKRAAEIAAAGFHNLLLTGSPGTGKSMIASAIAGILPPMNQEEMLDTSKVYSVTGLLNEECPFITIRPYQSPHHTITPQALIGGGTFPMPGVISLANHGVLFLDELPEFKRQTLDMLRQPLEEGKVVITRKHSSYTYPCDFMLIAAMNPCPCGYYPNRNYCNCSEKEVARYVKSISGPLLNRFDLCVNVLRNSYEQIKDAEKEENSFEIRKRVMDARDRQQQRNGIGVYNGRIKAKEIPIICEMTKKAERIVEDYYNAKNLSMRGYHRTLRVARSIADLEGEEIIQDVHVLEALAYRGLLDK